LSRGIAASGVSSSIPYSGGNGGSYAAQSINSTGVTGLTATLSAGNLSVGSGTIIYAISGIPSSAGTASFTINVGGQTCTLTRSINSSGTTTGITAHSCGTANVHNNSLPYGSMTDQQGNTYNTIVIGTQEWMAENLKTSIYRNGDTIPTNLSNSNWQFTTSGAWSYYNNNSGYDCPYGKLYNWYAVVDSRHICPSGWREPTLSDWQILSAFVNNNGGAIKSTSTSIWGPNNVGANNNSGFSAIPCGYKGTIAEFRDFGQRGYYWTSSSNGSSTSWYCRMYVNNTILETPNTDKPVAMGVRCIRE
jgi:uncharacterized protein (TIGR02145 family)